MDTPIIEFVRSYCDSGALRLHMPGHKGVKLLGMEELDLTEIHGADSLYEAEGIICRSEENASRLFGCPTYYSTEGSSQCIRAMLLLAMQRSCGRGEALRVLAGRNAHKTFLSACALLDVDVTWLCPCHGSYLSCLVTPAEVEEALLRHQPHAIYLTSPDYLGNVLDIEGISRVCRRRGVLLMVDNAHGAYLRFLSSSRHPMDLGADICCDSAHKTLPALTGGAYLHLEKSLADELGSAAKNALAMFGSTRPSYLILQSLDGVNRYLADGYSEKLNCFTDVVNNAKESISALGWTLCGHEVLKITLATKSMGYTGADVAAVLRERSIECEFSDPDYIVFMVTPETGEIGLRALVDALASIPRRDPISQLPPSFASCERAMSVRCAALSKSEELSIDDCVGRVLAAASVGCPPAVPIVVSGERISAEAVDCFRYYGIESCSVIKE